MGKGKNSKAKESEDFDQFLKQLQQTTKAAGAEKKKSQTDVVTQVERQRRHKELAESQERERALEFEKALERKNQQSKLQQLMQQLMAARQQQSPFLNAPKTEVEKETKSNALFHVGTGSMQGWRSHMEDAHTNNLDFSPAEKAGLFAVFDGHAGDKCAAIARIALPALAKKHYTPTTNEAQIKAFFATVFRELDETLKGKLKDGSGATCVVVLVTDKIIACGSVGDSRAILCRGGKCLALSEDHKPDTPHEKARIEAAGGHVENNRVNGQLAMSRAIGDFTYKDQPQRAAHEQLVTAVPDVVIHTRTAEDQYVVVACDGVFDVHENEALVELINSEIHTVKGSDDTAGMHALLEKVCHTCVAPPNGEYPSRSEGTDNVTFTLVRLLS